MRAQDARPAALPVSRFFGLTLVGLALAFGAAELDLGTPALVEIDRQGDDGDAVALDPAQEPIDLASMEEEAARTARLVVEARRRIFRDMGIDQNDLVV